MEKEVQHKYLVNKTKRWLTRNIYIKPNLRRMHE